jgi:hypothetical protein
MSNGTESPLKSSPGYDLNIARTCSFIVNVACDMCEQWKNRKFPWKPSDSCPITNKVYPVNQWTFPPDPVWSSFTPVGKQISEPFAVFANRPDDPQTVYLAFRGSQTNEDFIMDAKTGLVAYTPPTVTPITDIQVHHGFYDVFKGLDQTLNQTLSRIAKSGGKLIVTGHSLGSALATLTVPLACAAGIPSTNILHYNQASPKVGNANFQTYYNNLGVQTFRLVNTYDEVPNLPKNPAYVAVGVEVPFGAGYPTEPECHNPCCSYSYALFNPDAPYNPDMKTCMAQSKPEMRIP